MVRSELSHQITSQEKAVNYRSEPSRSRVISSNKPQTSREFFLRNGENAQLSSRVEFARTREGSKLFEAISIKTTPGVGEEVVSRQERRIRRLRRVISSRKMIIPEGFELVAQRIDTYPTKK